MLQVEIRIKGKIDKQWSEWFGGLTISHSDHDDDGSCRSRRGPGRVVWDHLPPARFGSATILGEE